MNMNFLRKNSSGKKVLSVCLAFIFLSNTVPVGNIGALQVPTPFQENIMGFQEGSELKSTLLTIKRVMGELERFSDTDNLPPLHRILTRCEPVSVREVGYYKIIPEIRNKGKVVTLPRDESELNRIVMDEIIVPFGDVVMRYTVGADPLTSYKGKEVANISSRDVRVRRQGSFMNVRREVYVPKGIFTETEIEEASSAYETPGPATPQIPDSSPIEGAEEREIKVSGMNEAGEIARKVFLSGVTMTGLLVISGMIFVIITQDFDLSNFMFGMAPALTAAILSAAARGHGIISLSTAGEEVGRSVEKLYRRPVFQSLEPRLPLDGAALVDPFDGLAALTSSEEADTMYTSDSVPGGDEGSLYPDLNIMIEEDPTPGTQLASREAGSIEAADGFFEDYGIHEVSLQAEASWTSAVIEERYPSGRIMSRTLEEHDDEGVIYYEYEDSGPAGEERINTKILSEVDGKGNIMYRYFFGPDGDIVRWAEYKGGEDAGNVDEYMPGYDNPVKSIRGKTVYTKVTSDGQGITLILYGYRDGTYDENPWEEMLYGENGENVYVLREYVGSHLENMGIHVSADPDLSMTGLSSQDWDFVQLYGTGGLSVYQTDPVLPYGALNGTGEGYPFTYHASGNVRTVFKGSSEAGGEWHVPKDTINRQEQSTGEIYEYMDEDFYAERPVRGLILELIAQADGGPFKDHLAALSADLAGANAANIVGIAGFLDNLENTGFMPAFRECIRDMHWVRPYEAHGRLGRITKENGSFILFEYEGGTDRIKGTSVYNVMGELIERRAASTGEKQFIVGGNMPWVRYGEDFGRRYDGKHFGFSHDRDPHSWEKLTGEEELRSRLKKWQGTESSPGLVRLFMFGDMRSGFVFDAAGKPVEIHDEVYDDMRMLLKVSGELNIRLIPVLFDYRMADGDGENEAAEYPGVITDTEKTEALLELLRPFFEEFGNNERIYGWEPMNEPEMSAEDHHNIVEMAKMQGFIRGIVEMIHQVTSRGGTATPDKVIVSSLTKEDMVKNWMIPETRLPFGDLSGADAFSSHYYDTMAEIYHPYDFGRLDYEITALQGPAQLMDPYLHFYAPGYITDKPVRTGEIDPTRVVNKMDTLSSHEGSGVFFWDDKGNIMDAREIAAARNWFPGTVYTYHTSTGGVRTERGSDLLDEGCVYRHYDIQGRVTVEILAGTGEHGVKAISYEYHGDSDVVSLKIAYHTAEFDGDEHVPTLTNEVFRERYDSAGVPMPGSKEWTATYYGDTWYRRSEVWDPSQVGVGEFFYKQYFNEYAPGREMAEFGRHAWSGGHYDEAYLYSYEGDSYGRFGRWVWNGIDATDPDNPVFIGYVRYDSWGDERVAYYPQQEEEGLHMEERELLSGPDEKGNVYYHYINEPPLKSIGRQRFDIAHRAEANKKDEIAFSYTYHGDTHMVERIISYSSKEMTNNNRVAEYIFDLSGRITSVLRFSGENERGEAGFIFSYAGDGAVPRRVISRDPSNKIMNEYNYDASGVLSVTYSGYDNLRRPTIELLSIADETGSIIYRMNYHGATNVVREKEGFRPHEFGFNDQNEVELNEMARVVKYTNNLDGSPASEVKGGVTKTFEWDDETMTVRITSTEEPG
ncbi:MAG: hypothetical protein WCV56_07540, partial [Candidatus Omnitrophota bacterium]